MDELLSIGEISKISGVSIQAIRYYEKIGLLKADYINPDSNYRYYNIKKLVHLDVIAYAKTIGIPLKSLKDIFQSGNPANISKFIETSSTEIDNQIQRLQKIQKSLNSLKESFALHTDVQKNNGIYKRIVPKRYIFFNTYKKHLTRKEEESILREFDRESFINNDVNNKESGYLININEFKNKNFLRCGSYLEYLEKNLNKKHKILESKEAICINYDAKNRNFALLKMFNYLEELNLLENISEILEVYLLNSFESEYFELQILFK